MKTTSDALTSENLSKYIIADAKVMRKCYKGHEKSLKKGIVLFEIPRYLKIDIVKKEYMLDKDICLGMLILLNHFSNNNIFFKNEEDFFDRLNQFILYYLYVNNNLDYLKFSEYETEIFKKISKKYNFLAPNNKLFLTTIDVIKEVTQSQDEKNSMDTTISILQDKELNDACKLFNNDALQILPKTMFSTIKHHIQ